MKQYEIREDVGFGFNRCDEESIFTNADEAYDYIFAIAKDVMNYLVDEGKRIVTIYHDRPINQVAIESIDSRGRKDIVKWKVFERKGE